jgi:2-oxoglutarate dehydrogenase E2 component (dihydrolipoamide succinyltransferase)
MPQLGENVTEGTITRWTKRIGESVTEDDVLFEVSTDKVDSEVPSPVSGVLTEILVAEGETVDVGTRLAMVSDGTSNDHDEAKKSSSSSTPDVHAPNTSSPADEEVQWASVRGPAYSPLIRKLIEESNLDPNVIIGTGAGGRFTRKDVLAARRSHAAEGNGKVESLEEPSQEHSPVVRRLLANLGLDPNLIVGTGAGGRITRSDVLGAAGLSAPTPDRTRAVRNHSSGSPVAPTSQETPRGAFDDDEIIPFSNIRRRTAEHTIRSKSVSAHTTVAIEVDFSNVDRTRAKWKQTFRSTEGFSLTYLPFAAMAAIGAIRLFPQVNSSVGDDALVVHHQIHVGIAVDLNFDGLLVPVIQRADGLRLRTLAREISTLSDKARTKKLSADDLSGGTFTITNAGPFGTLFTVPVINQPQVAILSTDGVKKKPVAIEMPDGSDGIAIHPVGNLAMSWDHRAFDGAYAAAFLKSIKDTLETRDWESEF